MVNSCPHVALPVLSAWAHSQGLHVGVLGCIPHLHRAVVGSAVELVGTSSEGQSLGRKERGQRVWITEGGQAQRGSPESKSHDPGACSPRAL